MQDFDYAKSSRFTSINMMRKAIGDTPLIWERFVTLSWKSISIITEDARVRYNKSIQ